MYTTPLHLMLVSSKLHYNGVYEFVIKRPSVRLAELQTRLMLWECRKKRLVNRGWEVRRKWPRELFQLGTCAPRDGCEVRSAKRPK